VVGPGRRRKKRRSKKKKRAILFLRLQSRGC
jgi:hypothetical protein